MISDSMIEILKALSINMPGSDKDAVWLTAAERVRALCEETDDLRGRVAEQTTCIQHLDEQLDVVDSERSALRAALREACALGTHYAGLECDSAGEEKFAELLKIAGGTKIEWLDGWEEVVPPRSEDGSLPGVRRLNVPGGWLYQVESHEVLAGTRIVTRIWHPPVFVHAEAV